MAVRHPFTWLPGGRKVTYIDWHEAHEDDEAVLYYGADKTGTKDSSVAFQNAIDSVGTPFVPPGIYRVDTLPMIRATGDGLRGAGSGVVTVNAGQGVMRVDPTQSAAIANCHLSGMTVLPQNPTAEGHLNGMSYQDTTCVDLTGVKESTVFDLSIRRFKKNFVLGYSTYQTYRNNVRFVRTWGGEVGIEVGGGNGDGANANVFEGCSCMASLVLLDIYGGLNSFLGTRLESPLQSNGYPPATTGIRFTSGHYATGNTLVDTYLELHGSGNTGIRVEQGTTGWPANITPNYIVGGVFSANGQGVVPSFYSQNIAIGFHLDAQGLRTRHLFYDMSDGSIRSRYYDKTGGSYTQMYDTSLKTITAETYGTEPPSSGYWIRGARCWNTEPTTNGITFWLCTSAGSPGEWEAVYAVDPNHDHDGDYAVLGHDHALSWTDVTYLNDWQDYSAAYYGVGYAKDVFGNVHLRGMCKGTSATAATVFQLPSGFRPSKYVRFTASAYDTATRLMAGYIDTSGNVVVQTPAYSGIDFAAFDGVTFSL